VMSRADRIVGEAVPIYSLAHTRKEADDMCVDFRRLRRVRESVAASFDVDPPAPELLERKCLECGRKFVDEVQFRLCPWHRFTEALQGQYSVHLEGRLVT
jgi:hypothetical protein